MDSEELAERWAGRRVVVAADVAKWSFVATVMGEDRSVGVTVKWRAPGQTGSFLHLVESLAATAQVEFALESTGTYGDALRYLLDGVGVPVFRVSAKRCHDAVEVYDGVPSSHDAKSAAIIGYLHLEGRSERWELKSEEERDLAAAVGRMAWYEAQSHACADRLEAKTARHFPELTELLELGSATLLALLHEYGGPDGIAADPAGADALMKQVGGSLLLADKRQKVLEAARHSTGAPLSPGERKLIQEARRNGRTYASHTARGGGIPIQ